MNKLKMVLFCLSIGFAFDVSAEEAQQEEIKKCYSSTKTMLCDEKGVDPKDCSEESALRIAGRIGSRVVGYTLIASTPQALSWLMVDQEEVKNLTPESKKIGLNFFSLMIVFGMKIGSGIGLICSIPDFYRLAKKGYKFGFSKRQDKTDNESVKDNDLEAEEVEIT